MDLNNRSEAPPPVMGPDDGLMSSNILTPPKLRHDTDKHLWREAVNEWAKTLLGCAAGEEKGCAATLGLTLYRSSHFSKKEMVKKAVQTGEIFLSSTGDQEIHHMQVVKQIIDLVAADSTIDSLRRLLGLHKEISACKRSKDGCMSGYIERFSGHALSYLTLTLANQDSSDSQNFAIAWLLNARLIIQIFSNTVSYLVVSSKNKQRSRDSAIPIMKERIENVIQVLKEFRRTSTSPDIPKDISSNIAILQAAISQKDKYGTLADKYSWIGFQDPIRALDEARLEGKDLEVNERTFDKRTSKNFMNSYEGSKRKNKRPLSDEENPLYSEHKSAKERHYNTTPSKCRQHTLAQNQDCSNRNRKTKGQGKFFFR